MSEGYPNPGDSGSGKIPPPPPSLFADENSERLAAAVTSYGVGTRSYNHSAEKREMDRQRAEATERFLAEHKPVEVLIPANCRCPQRSYPHELSVHLQLRAESYNPRLRKRWPWSLAISPRLEPSAEREAAA